MVAGHTGIQGQVGSTVAQRPERGGRQGNACGFRTEAAIRVKAEERGWWRARRTAGECGTTDADQPIDERALASADAG